MFNADTKGLVAISSDVKELAAKARQGKLQPQEYQVTIKKLDWLGEVDTFIFLILF